MEYDCSNGQIFPNRNSGIFSLYFVYNLNILAYMLEVHRLLVYFPRISIVILNRKVLWLIIFLEKFYEFRHEYIPQNLFQTDFTDFFLRVHISGDLQFTVLVFNFIKSVYCKITSSVELKLTTIIKICLWKRIPRLSCCWRRYDVFLNG